MYMNPPVQGVPQMNNYPIVGQPINQTQSGVPYDVLRQHLANKIAQHANQDIFTNTLYREAIGQTNNWMTGKMDSLVNITGITLDYIWTVSNRTRPPHELINEAVEDAYWCAWASYAIHPNTRHLVGDPSLASNRQSLDQWVARFQQNIATFEGMGLLTNNAVQNVPAYQTPSFQYGAPPGYNPQPYMQQSSYQQSSYRNTPTQMSNGYPYNNPQQGYMGGHGNYATTMSQHGGVSSAYTTQPTSGTLYSQSYQNQPQYNPNSSGLLSMDDLDDTKAALAERNQANTAQSTAQPVSYDPRDYTGYADISNVNQVPEKRVVMPKQPHELYESDVVTPTKVESWDGIPVKEIDLTNEKQMTQLFTKVVTSEACKLNLHEDEVRALTLQEVRTAVKRGTRFEAPYTSMLALSPLNYHLHCILTDKGEIRQIPTKMGEPMRLSAHLDVLKPIRERNEVKRALHPHRTYLNTTIGGVVYDRFKQAKVVLSEGLEELEKLPQDTSSDDCRKVVQEIFTNFQKQILKDIEDDKTGRSAFIEENTTIDEETGDIIEPPEFLIPEETKALRREMAENNIQTITAQEELITPSVLDSISATLADKVTNFDPELLDSSTIQTLRQNRFVSLFNDPEKRRSVLDTLQPFHRPEEGRRVELDSYKLYKKLVALRDKLPVEIFTRIDNRATQLINDMLPHVFKLPNISIDSFTEDYADLLATLPDLVLDNAEDRSKAKRGLDWGMGYMDIILRNALATFESLSDFTVPYANEDMVDLRAITESVSVRQVLIPELSAALGLTEKFNTVTGDDFTGVYGIVTLMMHELFSSIMSEESEAGNVTPYAALYLTTLDDVHYRIYPVCADYVPDEDDPHKEHRITDKFVLERLPQII